MNRLIATLILVIIGLMLPGCSSAPVRLFWSGVGGAGQALAQGGAHQGGGTTRCWKDAGSGDYFCN